MQYLLLIYNDEETWQRMPDEERGKIVQEYFALTDDLRERGAYVGGNPLQPTATATTVRVRDGEQLVTDGPFAETKEQLGGYFLVEAESIDEAIEYAGRIPGARHGSVEVRPIMEVPARAVVAG
jgi:hypothetical protein